MSLVLVAGTPEVDVSLKRILAGHQLVIVHTMEVATTKLEIDVFDLIIVSLHFDQSQMFGFMRLVKTIPKNATKPLVCFCARDTEMSRLMHESLAYTTRALGAWMYLNQHAYNVYQDPDAELRRVFERCLSGEERKEIQRQRMTIQKQRMELQEIRTLLNAHKSSPELHNYLAELKHELELLLRDVSKLHSYADISRAKIEASRTLKDRVSHQVTTEENDMALVEQAQTVDESLQSDQEQALEEKEETKEQLGQLKPAD